MLKRSGANYQEQYINLSELEFQKVLDYFLQNNKLSCKSKVKFNLKNKRLVPCTCQFFSPKGGRVPIFFFSQVSVLACRPQLYMSWRLKVPNLSPHAFTFRNWMDRGKKKRHDIRWKTGQTRAGHAGDH